MPDFAGERGDVLRVLLPDAFAPWLAPALEHFSKQYGVAIHVTRASLPQWLLSAGQLPQPPPPAPAPAPSGAPIFPQQQQAQQHRDAHQDAETSSPAPGAYSWASDPSLSYDVLLHPAAVTLQLADAGLLTDMGHLVDLLGRGLDWTGIAPQLRVSAGTYSGATVGVPLDGSHLATLYRGDVLTELGLRVPTTWTELLDFLPAYAVERERQQRGQRSVDSLTTALGVGADTDDSAAAEAAAGGGGGRRSVEPPQLPPPPAASPPPPAAPPAPTPSPELPPFALCLPLGAAPNLARRSGRASLLDTPAAAEAFRIVAALAAAAAPAEAGEGCGAGSLGFVRGRCALVLAAFVPQMRLFLKPDAAIDSSANGAASGTASTPAAATVVPQRVVRAARLPGSETIWRRGQADGSSVAPGAGAGDLTACTAELCPYAVLVGGDGEGDGGGGGGGRGARLVNFAPLLDETALVGSLSSRSNLFAQLTAYELLAYLASPERYDIDVAASGGAAAVNQRSWRRSASAPQPAAP